jgi:hypothetical protein
LEIEKTGLAQLLGYPRLIWGEERKGEVPEWPKGADCKSAGDAFEGSNPSLSTNFLRE